MQDTISARGAQSLLDGPLDTGVRMTRNGQDPLPMLLLAGRGRSSFDDHRLYGRAVLSATAYLGIADALGARGASGRAYGTANVGFLRPCAIPADEVLCVQVDHEPESGRFAIHASTGVEGSPGPKLAIGAIVFPGDAPPGAVDLAPVRARLREPVSAEALYAAFAALGLDYANAYRGVLFVLRRDFEAIGEIAVDDSPPAGLPFHPALLDSCLQVILPAVPAASREHGWPRAFVPLRVGRFRRFGAPRGRLLAHARVRDLGPGGLVADVDARAPDGTMAFEVADLRCVPLRPPREPVHRPRGPGLV